ncbi:MAG: hypothetical protein OXL97_05280 [Chloroflexota bacterium]|nr:hypothetical protein [Chloroflexota bacterium]MDE2884009.1 hypothetical protein [Chloroflexota bacterium]
MWRSGLLALAVVIVAGATPFLLERGTSGMRTIGEMAEVIQTAFAAAAIVVGGYWAYFKLRAFRDFEPHITITQAVSHRAISDSYTHIAVTATLHNSSKVGIELYEGTYYLQVVAPFEDEQIEHWYGQVFSDKEETNIQWPVYDTIQHRWKKGEFVIEPGESNQVTYEFIVLREVESVMAYAYFRNPKGSESPRTAQGWSATTVHDMVNTGQP